jgi:hypothetical protein
MPTAASPDELADAGHEFAEPRQYRFVYLVRPIVLAAIALAIVSQTGPNIAALPFVAFLLVIAIQDLRIHLLSLRAVRVTSAYLVATPQFGASREIAWDSIHDLQLVDRSIARPRKLLRLAVGEHEYFLGSDVRSFDSLVAALSARSRRPVRPFSWLQKLVWLQWGAS